VRVRHINSWQDERSEACARLEDELGDVLFDALLLGQLCAARSGGVRETDRDTQRERERERNVRWVVVSAQLLGRSAALARHGA
jgi:NTP pyrophosphatase (non-canonical NTP hydrolase)